MNIKRRGATIAFGLVLLALATSAGAQTINLYQASTGGTPQSQGWLTYQYNPLANTPSTTSTGGSTGSTTLDTTSDNTTTPDPNDPEEGGWSNYSYNPVAKTSSIVNSSFPSLNPTQGFSVSWTLGVNSESSTSTNRAGFDVIVLGSDEKGVELAYTPSDVFALQYSSGFVHDTSLDAGSYTTGPSLVTYDLSVLGGNFTLTANGSPIISGATQDYTGSAMLPYTLSNFVFMGDDTSESAANVTFSSLSVSVPEPITGLSLLTMGTIALLRRKRA